MIYKTQPMRAAFSMITAIVVIVLMATVAAFIMNISGKMVEETTTQYKKEQAILYAKSYTEFAVMAATSQDCIQGVDAHTVDAANSAIGNGYWIHIDVQYIGNDLPAAVCPVVGVVPIANPDSQGGVILLDTYVRYKNPDAPNIANSPWVTYYRRTLQHL